ncbi:3-phosphoshikimate 1-carboxyvinyltransferase [Peptoniphilus asaccharolyticus DSM 20463]|uniref:3-phosphoshikimate 1-carboxyvinyltransferase n=1 Tax=Peptoniphilus asaccharolyticus DSM 20463 TaxID=573058 RepID=A0A1W1VHY4_PEPAS|nr:3-phosphoshikimate 1-carboxyvinyltransferase [Peptoniphilus asaccharolyticus]MBL7574330.1 3-phosphoshikimate 1-carboxyvinyltransferase [Peptoniphilus asaccharolyticus]SMB92995.1 3-phosphoshikimate 1-carboxyvinyltransferase [Peptoniphilus asaccharolyticus DSM 20463]
MKIISSRLTGKIDAIPSKSYAHRALICAALADGISNIYFDKTSDDIDATIGALIELGAKINKRIYGVEVRGISKGEFPHLNMRESGSTFRFLLPVSATLYEECSFMGEGRLPERPISDLMEVMKLNGVEFDREKLPFKTFGNLKAGHYKLAGNVSSQYISGLLMAAPIMDKAVEIALTTELESKGYVDMTVQVMREFGANVDFRDGIYSVEPIGYKNRDYVVEGDWSNAAFFLVAGAISDKIEMNNLNSDSLQGDRKVLEILKDFGAEVEFGDTITVAKRDMRNIDVDLRDVPDLLPILSVLAASVNDGVSKFYNGERLRFKESDRLSTTAELITNLGGRVEEKETELWVYGTNGLRGGVVNSHNDHRIAMASAIASLISEGDIFLNGAEAVNKSYPKFFEDFKKLGGKYEL